MTDLIDRIKDGAAKIVIEDDFGPARTWDGPMRIGEIKRRSPVAQQQESKPSKKIATKQIAAIEASQPHVKLSQLPYDQWVRISGRGDSFDACLHLGKRKGFVSWRCDICGERLYVVEELHRVITLGVNEQRYERIDFRGIWGKACVVCGWHQRKWRDGDPEWGMGAGWSTLLDEDGHPSREYHWIKA